MQHEIRSLTILSLYVFISLVTLGKYNINSLYSPTSTKHSKSSQGQFSLLKIYFET